MVNGATYANFNSWTHPGFCTCRLENDMTLRTKTHIHQKSQVRFPAQIFGLEWPRQSSPAPVVLQITDLRIRRICQCTTPSRYEPDVLPMRPESSMQGGGLVMGERTSITTRSFLPCLLPPHKDKHGPCDFHKSTRVRSRIAVYFRQPENTYNGTDFKHVRTILTLKKISS